MSAVSTVATSELILSLLWQDLVFTLSIAGLMAMFAQLRAYIKRRARAHRLARAAEQLLRRGRAASHPDSM